MALTHLNVVGPGKRLKNLALMLPIRMAIVILAGTRALVDDKVATLSGQS